MNMSPPFRLVALTLATLIAVSSGGTICNTTDKCPYPCDCAKTISGRRVCRNYRIESVHRERCEECSLNSDCAQACTDSRTRRNVCIECAKEAFQAGIRACVSKSLSTNSSSATLSSEPSGSSGSRSGGSSRDFSRGGQL